MYKTEHGDFNGITWEEFCQICFKRKYEEDGYQEMPAWQGDLVPYLSNSCIFWQNISATS
jgi:hypothetical protein